MVGKNIKYYRLMKNMSQAELAQQIGLNKMTISHYESNKRTPDYETSRKLANSLGITLSMLLSTQSDELAIEHGAFRKKASVTKAQQDLIFGHEDRYLGRLFDVVSFLGETALAPMPVINPEKAEDYEKAGQHLRQVLGLSASGPIGNITDILENNGFVICPIDIIEKGFSGNSGFVNGRPFIAVNTRMPAERQRFTLIHELAHLYFIFDADKNEERMVDGIAGAFLLPEVDIKRELGVQRKDIRSSLRIVQQEYNISMAAIVMRAYQTKIITKPAYEITMKWMSAQGLRMNEQSGIEPEKTHLLEQLTLRAVAEDEIGVSKAAEILERPLLEIRKLCYGGA